MKMTEETAHTRLCPLARTFGQAPSHSGCRGSDCAVWRWEKITTAHPLWSQAVRAEAEKIQDRPPFARAARIVADDPEAFGLVPKLGYCGLGGEA